MEIKARADSGNLYKSLPPLEIIKGTGSDLIVGGYASWELVDPEHDLITVKGMSNFMRKFFALEPEYQNIMLSHGDFKAGVPLLKYTNSEGRTYYSHVNEKGMYLLSKVRNDGLEKTRQVRDAIKRGEYRMYSVAGMAIKAEKITVDGEEVRKVDDMDPYEVSYVPVGMNPKAEFQVLSKASDGERSLKTDLVESYQKYFPVKEVRKK
jgi:hypothetical protein